MEIRSNRGNQNNRGNKRIIVEIRSNRGNQNNRGKKIIVERRE